MDNLESYRKIIEKVLLQWINITYANMDIQNEIVLDSKNDRYLVLSLGWDGPRRIHACLIHIDIINKKVWIQKDSTEEGVAVDLEKAGIPKNEIVLGFQEPNVRQYTEYAVA